MEFIRTAEQLLEILKQPDPRGYYKELYSAYRGGWGVTYSPDIMINPEAVTDIFTKKILYPTYRNSNCCYWLGALSIDIDYITEKRKRVNPNYGLVYYDDSTGRRIHEKDLDSRLYPRSPALYGYKLNKKLPNRVTLTEKAVKAYELYENLGNMRRVAEIMGCSHQNVSFLIKKYKLYHNIARKTRRIV